MKKLMLEIELPSFYVEDMPITLDAPSFNDASEEVELSMSLNNNNVMVIFTKYDEVDGLQLEAQRGNIVGFEVVK
jgi:hypothetical protein